MSSFDDERPDVLSGGIRMVPTTTPAGTHRVWLKRTGSNLATKMLLLHGGHLAMYDDRRTYMRGLLDWLAAQG
jgi:hypothetical protein